MELKELTALCLCPCGCGKSPVLADDAVVCPVSGCRTPILHGRMIDFLSSGTIPTPISAERGWIFRLNEFYNTRLEQKIAHSLLAAGGLGSIFLENKIKTWIDRLGPGLLLDAGSGDQKWKQKIPGRLDYIPLDYLPAAASSPWRNTYPQINADTTRLPFKEGSFDAVMSIFVIEHVRSPQRLLEESVRVLKPGGHLLLAGPGDILMSHGEPFNYFNLTRHAYAMLLEPLDAEIVEEYYPSKFWMSVASLVYQKIVRNDCYNRHAGLKLVQLIVLGFSLLISPFVNLIAWILDLVTPFDRRGYAAYAVLVKKKVS